MRGPAVRGGFEDAEGHGHAARRAVGDDPEGEGGVPARPIGQSRRRGAQRAQPRRRQDNGAAGPESCGEGRRLFLAGPVGGEEPGREDPPAGPVQRLAAGDAARLVMEGQRASRDRRQQQHAEQRARTAAVLADGPAPEFAPKFAQGCAWARHPKTNPMSLAPSPSSQAAVIWAAVTGEARVAPLIAIEITPARARLRPA